MADTLKSASDESLQAEITRRQIEADKQRRKERTAELKPLLELGFGVDEPINLSVKDLCAKLDDLRRTFPDDINDQYRQAAVTGLRGIDSSVRMILPEEEPMAPE